MFLCYVVNAYTKIPSLTHIMHVVLLSNEISHVCIFKVLEALGDGLPLSFPSQKHSTDEISIVHVALNAHDG